MVNRLNIIPFRYLILLCWRSRFVSCLELIVLLLTYYFWKLLTYLWATKSICRLGLGKDHVLSPKKKNLKTTTGRLQGWSEGNINYDAVGTTPTKPISDHAHTIIHFYQITYVSNHLASLQIYNAALTCLSWRRLFHVIVATSKSRSHKVFPGGYQNEVQREVSSKLHRICSTVAKKQAFERLVV